jgi:hypothetical protein
MNGKCPKLALLLLLVLSTSKLRAQGPPYQTDDPVPVDLHHYEFYIFGGVDGTPAEIDSTGPAVEFNWAPFPGCNCTPYSRGEASSHRTILFTCPVELVQALSVSLTWNWA